jgi:hypothetical protein
VRRLGLSGQVTFRFRKGFILVSVYPYGACVGRHSLATSRVSRRRKSSVGVAALIAPAAVFFAAGADVQSVTAAPAPKPVADLSVCCVEFVDVESGSPSFVASDASSAAAPHMLMAASRMRVVDVPRLLPVGLAPEKGLQVETILVSRAITAAFPEIHQMGGVRPDPLPWHPNGLAVDVMIPNPSSAEGIALGNQIVAFVLKNAGRFGMQDAIWRGMYYTPNGGAQAGGYGHFDHVHVTTHGGGYPTGNETYYR